MNQTTIERLRDNFLAATRGKGYNNCNKSIMVNGKFDIHGIKSLDKNSTYSEYSFETVELEDAYEAKFEVTKPEIVTTELPNNPNRTFLVETLKIFLYKNYIICMTFTYLSTLQRNTDLKLFDRNRKLINNLFFGAKPFLDQNPISRIEENTYSEDFFASFNLCHLLFDKIPRVIKARELSRISLKLLFSGLKVPTLKIFAIDLELKFTAHQTKLLEELFISNLVGVMRIILLVHPGLRSR